MVIGEGVRLVLPVLRCSGCRSQVSVVPRAGRPVYVHTDARVTGIRDGLRCVHCVRAGLDRDRWVPLSVEGARAVEGVQQCLSEAELFDLSMDLGGQFLPETDARLAGVR